MNEDGTPKWRMAPSPRGAYWEEGQKLGYQDTGAWTLMKSTPEDRAKAAWLYAQFVTSKTVSLKKSHVGLTIIRDSDVRHESFTERSAELGGPRRILSLARASAVDTDRYQRAGLSALGAAVVAKHWRRLFGRQDSAAGTNSVGLSRRSV
jgi:ABC-type glycerol-3-phosphate transport system substrate-binding protein